MYCGPADVTFMNHYIRMPAYQQDAYFNTGVEITLIEFKPRIAQLEFGANLVGVPEPPMFARR